MIKNAKRRNYRCLNKMNGIKNCLTFANYIKEKVQMFIKLKITVSNRIKFFKYFFRNYNLSAR